jgi:5,10-methenyltetrahydrofolate synthetase
VSAAAGHGTKDDWRTWAKTIDRAQESAAVVASLESWPPLHGTVLSYLSMADEVDVGPIHSFGRCRIAITRTPPSGSLSVHEYQPEGLESHRLGFEQPTEDAPRIELDDIDVVLVPGLAFDRRGNRLGWGKGYYDELLARLPVGVIRVGVTVDELLVDLLPTEDHDQRVAWVATESGVHRTGVSVSDATDRFVSGAIPWGVAPDIHRFPTGTRTSADAAEAVGAELGEIAKSILFEVDGEPVLVIASGDRRISEPKLVEWFNGDSTQIVDRAAVHDRTGFVVGGTPAIGLPKSVRILADSGLGRYRWVWSAGGTPDTVYPVALDRLIAASGARWADVTDRGK